MKWLIGKTILLMEKALDWGLDMLVKAWWFFEDCVDKARKKN